MSNKKNIIIALICAILVTLCVFIFRGQIAKFFAPEEDTPVTTEDFKGDRVSGSEFFDNLGDPTKGDANGDLGQGEFSYTKLSENYSQINTLYLSIENTTIVTENGKVMDSQKDKQIFNYKSKDKLSVVSQLNSIYCDGKTVTRYIPQAKTYMTDAISEDFFTSMITGSPALNTIGLLLGADYSGRIKKYEFVKKEAIEGKNCNLIKITLDGQGQVPDFIQKLWLEEKTGVIIKNTYEITRVMKNNGKVNTMVMKVSNITKSFKLNEPIKDSAFKFVPKSGDKKYDPAKEAAEMAKQAKLMQEMEAAEKAKALLEQQKVETPQAPKVEAPKKSKEEVMAQMAKDSPIDKQIYNFKAEGFKPSSLRGKKLIIVFWAYGMGDEFLPTLSNFARANKDKYTLVTINVNAKSKELQNHVNDNKYSFPVYYIDDKSSGEVVKKLQLMTLPAIYFVNEIGVVKDVIYGTTTRGHLESTAKEKLDTIEIIEEENVENKEAENEQN